MGGGQRIFFLQTFRDFIKLQLMDRIVHTSDEIKYSKLELSLQQFIECCKKFCSIAHTECTNCQKLTQAAQDIQEEGIRSLSSLYKKNLP